MRSRFPKTMICTCRWKKEQKEMIYFWISIDYLLLRLAHDTQVKKYEPKSYDLERRSITWLETMFFVFNFHIDGYRCTSHIRSKTKSGLERAIVCDSFLCNDENTRFVASLNFELLFHCDFRFLVVHWTLRWIFFCLLSINPFPLSKKEEKRIDLEPI